MKRGIKRIVGASLALVLSSSALAFAGCGTAGGNSESGASSEKNVMEEISFTRQYFQGKKAVVYGDSITYGAMTSGSAHTWIHKLAQGLDFTYTNFAVNGAMLTYVAAMRDGRGSGAQYVADNAAANAQADYAFLFFGANDFTHGVPVGRGGDRAAKLEEVGSFAQGVAWAADVLRRQNEDIKIIFITPLYRDDVTRSSLGFKISEFGNIIKEMSGALNYYYVDVGDLFTPENYGADSVYTDDRLHPNDLGQQTLFLRIASGEIRHG